MKQIFIYFLAIMFMNSCASKHKKTEEELSNLRFMDADTFDKNLSESMMVDTKTITVSMIGKVSINNMPKRLSKWLSIITAKNGQVDFEPTTPLKPPVNERTTGSLSVGAIIGILPTAYDFLKDELSYGSAINYNAVLYYQPNNGLLERISFIKKNE
ncbi:hypothetical protein QUF74_01920 [Candidatus Halobeggiatoa sp. HSG11]|nr:hypothetical protein [Candidatus Halobeggiatoa sp. HSG11]